MMSIETLGPIPGTDIQTMYAICGPMFGVFPQCGKCRKLQGDSDEPIYCGRYFPVAYIGGKQDDRD